MKKSAQEAMTVALVQAGTKLIDASVDIGIKSLNTYMQNALTPTQKKELGQTIKTDIESKLQQGKPVNINQIVSKTKLPDQIKKQLSNDIIKEINLKQNKQVIKQQNKLIKEQQKIIRQQQKLLN
jgi:hypothetical protein